LVQPQNIVLLFNVFTTVVAPHFFIVAGEASGDIHGARLMRALKHHAPGCRFSGIGGARMAEEGLQSLVPMEHINIVGFWEVAKRYPFFKRLLAECRQILASTPFDAFIPVDYPGFNMRLAAFAKEFRIPVYWYIAPQLWAWGSNRAEKLRTLVDKLFVVFPFEVEFFRRYAIQAEFVGHPLLDDPDFTNDAAAPLAREPLIALLPGSRAQEIGKNLPIMLKAASILASKAQNTLPNLRFAIAAPPTIDKRLYSKHVTMPEIAGLPITFEHQSRALMRRAAAGIVKTGTSTLEAALCNMPFAMMYKTSALSYYLAKRMITLSHIALVNIVADWQPQAAPTKEQKLSEEIVREFIQHEATPEAIAAELYRIITEAQYAHQMHEGFARVRHLLGKAGAANNVAQQIVVNLREHQPQHTA
jgi:lipid-A-disaccharide synthase